MRFFAFVTTLFASLQLCNANFYIWAVELHDLFGGVLEGYDVYDHPQKPSCSEVSKRNIWQARSDVSGSKTGVRCVGECDMVHNGNNVDVFEMHWTNNPLFHWTLYKSRGHPYKMYGLDGNVYGDCVVYSGEQFHCANFGAIHGHRKFHCRTRFTTQQILDGKR
ncbi:hypothetical protein B0T11DRAFT_316869 [Plectosphaerella cucumerina]|uniref:Uncharacterized protein n=1 Tax=Plectosphaerella cucumerina TaxID=40658 RepID=A0A8K0TNF1_9PEZI|nr:hypothetical protein B0T11DRAFT_316869 [Plectosphaerella cucumerina]